MGRTRERGREFIPKHVEVRSAGQPSNHRPSRSTLATVTAEGRSASCDATVTEEGN